MRDSAVPTQMDDKPLPSHRPSAASGFALWRGAARDGPVRLQLVSARALPGFFVVAPSIRGSCPEWLEGGRRIDGTAGRTRRKDSLDIRLAHLGAASARSLPSVWAGRGSFSHPRGTFARGSRKLPRINVQGARWERPRCLRYEGLTHEERFYSAS